MHIRLDCGYFGRGNYKRFELLKILGPESDIYPIRIWTWMFDKGTGGILKDQDFALEGKFDSPKQVEWAAQWTGEPGKLVKALVETNFLDADLHIHNWHVRCGNDLAGWLNRKQDRHKNRSSTTAQEPTTTEPTKPPTNRSNSPEALLVAKWNGLKNGFPISESSGVEKIQGYVARGVPLTTIDEAMRSGSTTDGKKLWEVLEPLCPQKLTGEGGVDQYIRLKKLTGKMP